MSVVARALDKELVVGVIAADYYFCVWMIVGVSEHSCTPSIGAYASDGRPSIGSTHSGLQLLSSLSQPVHILPHLSFMRPYHFP